MTSVARVEPISGPRQFKDYSEGTLLNFNVVDIKTVYFISQGENSVVKRGEGGVSPFDIPYFEYTFARKMKDSSIGQRLFSVNETSSSKGRIIGDVLSNEFTLDDLGKIFNDVNQIYAVFPRIPESKEILNSVRESINLTLQELIKQKTRQDQSVNYFKMLPDLNFIVKDISVTNVDKNNIPYLSYYIYSQDKKLLFRVMEFNKESSNFLTLLVKISEITMTDLDKLRNDIEKIYIRKDFTFFDNVVMDMYFRSKGPIRDSILEEIDIIETAMLSDPDSSETVSQTSNGTTPNGTQGGTEGSTDISKNIENGDKKSSLSSLQILGIVFGSLLLAALVIVLIVLIVNLLRKKT
jgi:hypothetical protein